MNRFGRRVALALGLGLAAPAAAVTGSGMVEFRFGSFFGPYGVVVPPDANGNGGFSMTGTVNGATPINVGSLPANPEDATYTLGLIGPTTNFGPFPQTGAPTTTVTLLEDPLDAGTPRQNIFSWSANPFTNVAIGQTITLGTLTFQNGSWFGAGFDVPNVVTTLRFKVTTTSADGPVFNQVRNLSLVHTANRLIDPNTLQGLEAAADWVTLRDEDNGIVLNSFRVFDAGLAPAGFTNVGTVDLIGRFGSLDIIGFANPAGGFLTDSSDPLPPGGGGGPPAIPEPASWALLIAGFGLTGAVARRRRRVAA